MPSAAFSSTNAGVPGGGQAPRHQLPRRSSGCTTGSQLASVSDAWHTCRHNLQ